MNITDFINEELYQSLFERVQTAFPSMDFQTYNGGWASRFKLDGTETNRKDKSVITRRVPHRIIEQGGGSLSLVDFYMRQHNKSFIDAVKDLCEICNLELPKMEDEEKYRAYKEKQDALEVINGTMQAALYSEAGEAVLSYLKGRGYDDDFIKYAGFGYCSKGTSDKLKPLFVYKDAAGQEVCTLPYDAGEKYLLSIPYRSGGRIKGFVFRRIDDERPKYKDAFTSATASKKYNLFGLTGLNLTGDKEKDKDITIVEGEIDALRASFAGIPNVVAASGGVVSKEALEEVKRRGVKRVTLLFDNDDTAKGRAEIKEKTKKAIEVIEGNGLKCFVASFTEYEEVDKKIDADTYLRNHTGEDLQKIIDKAFPSSVWLFWRIKEEVGEKDDGQETATYKNIDEFKSQVLELCNKCAPSERENIFALFGYVTQNYISKETLQEEADLQREMANSSRQQEEAKNLAAQAYTLAREGRTDEALTLMASRTSTIQQISKEQHFEKLLHIPTTEEERASLKRTPAGIATPFAFGDGDNEERLLLPSGALTYVCAPTSHGKSRMLQNLALAVATNGQAGSVLYFTFEEDRDATKAEFLNIYANMLLSANNLKSIRSYYRTGNGYFKRGTDTDAFKKKEAEFMSILKEGKLRIFYEDIDAKDLIESIRYLVRQIDVKAVFVDYIQLLHIRGTKLMRKDELKEMCKDFMKLSVSTGLPVVLGSQLNRETPSPLDMAVQNIAEASDIEHSANIVMLLWNSNTPDLSSKGSYHIKDGKLSKAAEALEARGFHIGQAGKVYAILAKNRGGRRNIDAVLDFDGNRGVFSPNYFDD